MKRHYGIGYIDPRFTILSFGVSSISFSLNKCLTFGQSGGLSNRQLMWPPSMLVEYLHEFNGFIKYFLKRGE